jgi:hypothetical protein
MNPDSHMQPDNYQQAWRAQSSQTRVTFDADLLIKEVQRSQQEFRATIFCRDFLEIGVALLLLPYWFYAGIKQSLPWTWWLTVPALVWVAGFILVDRRRHPQKPSEAGEPLTTSVKQSLTQVEHQIWLLRNIFWWYLLPFTISISAFFADVAWRASDLGFAAFLFLFLFAVYSFIYYVNQRAVRVKLQPRRDELLKLLTSLTDETTSEVSGEYPILMSSASRKKPGKPRRFLASLLALAIFAIAIGLAGILFFSGIDHRERSPFAAVRWQQSQPEVKVGNEWFKLISLEGLPASEIVAFSQTTYGSKWQKRFEEDLVELLTRMGHPPQDKVTLVVQSLTSPETRKLEGVRMTRANRQAIRNAAQARNRNDQ